LNSLLEHIPEPEATIKELHRILKPGGKAISISPFIIPYHGYPRHYVNFSKDGLEYLFRDFSECRVVMGMGPMTGIINLWSEYLALALGRGNNFGYMLFKGLALLPIFYLKYLDKFWSPTGRALRMASSLCALITK